MCGDIVMQLEKVYENIIEGVNCVLYRKGSNLYSCYVGSTCIIENLGMLDTDIDTQYLIDCIMTTAYIMYIAQQGLEAVSFE